MDIKSRIRTIPDHPKPGIMFRDITTLLGDARAFRTAVDLMVQPYAGVRIDKVTGIEARGFILGGAVAHQLSVGFAPVRKKGKLPARTIAQDYELEYGVDTLELHADALRTGDQVLIVDDLIATGGTALATVKLIERLGARAIGASFVIDLPELGGVDTLELHADALRTGDQVLIVDDLIATGGTALATVKLIERLGARAIGASFVIDLPELGGAEKLRALGLHVDAICAFDGH